jgi:hypothetical protein
MDPRSVRRVIQSSAITELPGDLQLSICARSGCSGRTLLLLSDSLFPRRDGVRPNVLSSDVIVNHLTNHEKAHRRSDRVLLGAIRSDREDVVRGVLAWYGSDVPVRSTYPFEEACKIGNEGIVRLLMGWKGYTPERHTEMLRGAARSGHANVLRMLIDDYFEQNSAWYSMVLSLAVTHNHEDVTRLVTDHVWPGGARLPAVMYEVAYATAAKMGRENMVLIILESKNAPRADCGDGEALLGAVSYGHEDIVTLLLDWPKNPPMAEGAISEATSSGRASILAILRSHMDPV